MENHRILKLLTLCCQPDDLEDFNRLTREILTNNHAKSRERGIVRTTELVRCLRYLSVNSVVRKGLSTRSISGKIAAATPAME